MFVYISRHSVKMMYCVFLCLAKGLIRMQVRVYFHSHSLRKKTLLQLCRFSDETIASKCLKRFFMKFAQLQVSATPDDYCFFPLLYLIIITYNM